MEAEHPLETVIQAVSEAETKNSHIELEPFNLEEIGAILRNFLLDESSSDDEQAIDRVSDLCKVIFKFTNGNTLWIMLVLRLLNDRQVLSFDEGEQRFNWKKLAIKKEVKNWREGGDKVVDSIFGAIESRVEKFPKKIRFLIEVRILLEMCLQQLLLTPCLFSKGDFFFEVDLVQLN